MSSSQTVSTASNGRGASMSCWATARVAVTANKSELKAEVYRVAPHGESYSVSKNLAAHPTADRGRSQRIARRVS